MTWRYGPINQPPILGSPEKGFQQAVIDYAVLTGWTVGFTWNSKHSPYGEPDLRMARVKNSTGDPDARVVWAELKKEDGQPTAEQYEWLELGRHVPGVETYLWRPSDWDEIQEVLR